jgi:hypothetical protein
MSDLGYRMATTVWVLGIESPWVVVNLTVPGRVKWQMRTAAS